MKTEKLKELLSYSRREKNGILVLIVFVIIVGCINLSLPFLLHKPSISIESLHIDWGPEDESNTNQQKSYPQETYAKDDYRFESSDPANFNPYSNAPFEQTPFVKKAEFNGMVEINTADTSQLMQLKGVGAYFAKKIIKYRDRLGGFTSIAQIKEIYNFPVELADQIAPQLSFGEAFIQKIHINSIPDTLLDNHPYLSRVEAKTLIAYRDKHGRFESCDDLLKSITIKKEVSDRLCPYLVFD